MGEMGLRVETQERQEWVVKSVWQGSALIERTWHEAKEPQHLTSAGNQWPAVQRWTLSGALIYEAWMDKGVLHRNHDLPALQTWFDPQMTVAAMMSSLTEQNETTGAQPTALILPSASQGVQTRPCSQKWYLNGQKTRDNDRPAELWFHPNGQCMIAEYWVAGQQHRESGPAVVHWNEYGAIKKTQWYYFDDAYKGSEQQKAFEQAQKERLWLDSLLR